MEPQLPPRLAEARAALTSLTASTAALQREAGLDVEPEAHCAEVLHCGLMEVGARYRDCNMRCNTRFPGGGRQKRCTERRYCPEAWWRWVSRATTATRGILVDVVGVSGNKGDALHGAAMGVSARHSSNRNRIQ